MGPFGPPTPPRVVLLPVHNHTHNMALELAQETIWFDKWKCDDAEKQFYEKQTGSCEEVEGQSVEVEDTPVDSNSQVEEPKRYTSAGDGGWRPPWRRWCSSKHRCFKPH